jgi:hypothetical protein
MEVCVNSCAMLEMTGKIQFWQWKVKININSVWQDVVVQRLTLQVNATFQ